MRKSGVALATVGIAVAVIALAVPALAQPVVFHGAIVDASAVPPDPATPSAVNPPGDTPEMDVGTSAWGTSLWSVYNAGPCDVTVRSGSAAVVNANCEWVAGATTSDVHVGFPVHLPAGAVAQYTRIYFRQTVLADTISGGFWKRDQYGAGTSITNMSPAATTAGDTYAQWGPFNEVIDNNPTTGYTYSFLAIFPGTTTRIYKMMVYYKLAVSPAPSTATFTDVPTTAGQFQYVEALVAAGITAGCGTNLYCPDTPVTRGQMAVFLARALGLSYQY